MSKVIGSGGGGGKGGGGGGGTPTEAKDNLDSKQFAKVLDLISEGGNRWFSRWCKVYIFK